MRTKKFFGLLFVLAAMCLLSCNKAVTADVNGCEIAFSHSSLLRIVESDGYTVAEVRNPWGEGVLQRYILVPRDSAVPENIPEGRLLRVPWRE